MSFVTTTPQVVAAAANDLANIGSSIGVANNLAASPTTAALAAGADQVSAAAAAFFTAHAQQYQSFGAQMASFHEQFVAALHSDATSYANAEAANVAQARQGAINAPTQTLLGRH